MAVPGITGVGRLLLELSLKVGWYAFFEKQCKTSYSIFGSKDNVLPGTKLCINYTEIQQPDCCKYLGLLIDSDLKWQIT